MRGMYCRVPFEGTIDAVHGGAHWCKPLYTVELAMSVVVHAGGQPRTTPSVELSDNANRETRRDRPV